MAKFLDSTGVTKLVSLIKSALGGKQDTLVSGTSIKTVNSNTLLGSGNMLINGVANVTTPSTTDGTFALSLDNGDNITFDLNHIHSQYQETLVSGTNIKTVNNTSLLGSGDITISGGVQSDWSQSDSSEDDYIKNKPTLATVATSGSYSDLSNKPANVSSFTNDAGYLTSHQNIKTINSASIVGSGNVELQTPLTFDSTPTASSPNPVTSGGVKTALDTKQDTLVSGTSIKTVNNNSLLGSGNVTIEAEDGIGFDDINTPTPVDGTTTISLTNGDTITLDLNHVHPQYLKYELVSSLPASPDSGTLYLIAASS